MVDLTEVCGPPSLQLNMDFETEKPSPPPPGRTQEPVWIVEIVF